MSGHRRAGPGLVMLGQAIHQCLAGLVHAQDP